MTTNSIIQSCCVIGAVVVLSGCYTAKALRIGEEHEWPRSIVSVYRDGDQLVIPVIALRTDEVVWRPADDRGREEPIVPEVSRWATADVGTLAWGPIMHPDAVPGRRQRLTLHDEPAPQTPVPPYEEIPLVRLPPLGRKEVDRMRSELRERLDSHRLLAASVGESGLLLVRRDPQAADGLSMASVQIDGRLYRTWWAIPARVVAVPFAIPIDAVCMPVWYIHTSIYGWH